MLYRFRVYYFGFILIMLHTKIKVTNMLWKKGKDTLYVDLISEAGPRGICVDTNEQGNIIVTNLRSNISTNPLRADPTTSTLNKSDAIAIEKRDKGNRLFVQQQWFEAMEKYNESLCFAEEGSVNISLAYANRAFTFLKLEMYNECFADIELAKNSGYPDMSKLDQRKEICLKSMKEGEDGTESPHARLEPKLSYESNKTFPCLANILNIECSRSGEVVITAKEDIAVGQIVAIEESFTHSLHSRFGWKCCICLKQSVNLVPCQNCTVAMFCSDKCQESFLHTYECGKIMKGERMEQMRGILLAINIFSDADELIDFVEQAVNSDCNEVPDNLIDARSKYRIFLKLPFNSKIGQSEFFGAQCVFPIYKYLLDIPKIGEFFKSLKHQRFLMHLIAHHVQIGHRNTRVMKPQLLKSKVELEAQYSSTGLIHPYFIHSCAPNIQMISFDNKSIFLTVRPVKEGESLHLSLFPFLQESKKIRQKVLWEEKDVLCKCIRCKGRNASYSMCQRMSQDHDYCFIKSKSSPMTHIILNYVELVNRCIAFLTKYGHEIWSDEIGEVVTVFVALKRMEIQGFTLQMSETFSLAMASSSSTGNLLPYFDFDVQRNVTVTVGQTGFLHCRVERLGDKDVSWIRKRDLHILTAGVTVYTSDQRFQVNRPKNSSIWTLQIKYPQLRDAGIYECQINTEPKMSLSYTLHIIELKANIGGPADLYVKSGSDINLQCKIAQGPHELGNIFWYKGNEIVDMVGHENEIYSKTTQRITEDTDWADGLISRLKIRRATPNDSGNYSCVPTIAKPTSVYVHVIIGEHPAAMQHNSARATTTITSTNSVLMVLYTTIFCQTLLAQFVNAIYSRWLNGLVR